MSRWFRFYDDAINDPKILRLPDDLYRSWIGILCIASKGDGVLPCVEDVAILLRMSVSSAQNILSELERLDLLDRFRNGTLSPHNWRKRQYKSDVSTDRVRQFRKRSGNVSVTPPDTEQIQTTDTDKRDDDTSAKAPLISQEAFEVEREMGKIVGIDPGFIPPAWFGAPHKVQAWLSGGWPAESIIASTRIQMAARIGKPPPSTASYFEKGIADFIANNARPIPIGAQNGSSSSTELSTAVAYSNGQPRGGNRQTQDDIILAGMRLASVKMAGDRKREREANALSANRDRPNGSGGD